MTDALDNLRDAIRRLHGCDSCWSRHAPVREMFQGRVVWDGIVEVFDLIGHPSATQCYAWANDHAGRGGRVVAVLHEAAIDSPEKAVRASIIAKAMSGGD